MLKSFKTEINPTEEQKMKINKTIGTCRFVYNFYIAKTQEWYNDGKPFMDSNRFNVWMNNEFLPNNPNYIWIKDVYTKAVKNSLDNACNAYKNFFKKQAKYPRFKKKGKSNVKMYFYKNNPSDCICERHRIKIPSLGWVKLKEKGYLPTTKDGYVVKSGHISIEANRYFVSILVDIPNNTYCKNGNQGIGIDLGVKEFATLSNGETIGNINKTQTIKSLEKRLAREQRKLLRMKKGENYSKQKIKVQKIYQRLTNIRTNHVNQSVAKIVKTKPSYVTIEDLNVNGMMKNRHLSKSVANQGFYTFRTKLTNKCHENGIEVRVANRFYPSSKTCNNCGCVNKDLKLSDRTYHCPACGFTIDRDFNASLNLRDLEIYEIA